jgi:Holliday junction resolvase RusA-like endonuclease
MKVIEFVIPDVVSQGRPRFVSKRGRAWIYYDARTKRGRQLIIDSVKEKYPDLEPSDGRFSVYIEVHLPSSKRKIDLDNIIKIILDSLNNIVWKDDKCVSRIVAQKITGPEIYYATTYIKIEKMEENNEI